MTWLTATLELSDVLLLGGIVGGLITVIGTVIGGLIAFGDRLWKQRPAAKPADTDPGLRHVIEKMADAQASLMNAMEVQSQITAARHEEVLRAIQAAKCRA